MACGIAYYTGTVSRTWIYIVQNIKHTLVHKHTHTHTDMHAHSQWHTIILVQTHKHTHTCKMDNFEGEQLSLCLHSYKCIAECNVCPSSQGVRRAQLHHSKENAPKLCLRLFLKVIYFSLSPIFSFPFMHECSFNF